MVVVISDLFDTLESGMVEEMQHSPQEPQTSEVTVAAHNPSAENPAMTDIDLSSTRIESMVAGETSNLHHRSGYQSTRFSKHTLALETSATQSNDAGTAQLAQSEYQVNPQLADHSHIHAMSKRVLGDVKVITRGDYSSSHDYKTSFKLQTDVESSLGANPNKKLLTSSEPPRTHSEVDPNYHSTKSTPMHWQQTDKQRSTRRCNDVQQPRERTIDSSSRFARQGSATGERSTTLGTRGKSSQYRQDIGMNPEASPVRVAVKAAAGSYGNKVTNGKRIPEPKASSTKGTHPVTDDGPGYEDSVEAFVFDGISGLSQTDANFQAQAAVKTTIQNIHRLLRMLSKQNGNPASNQLLDHLESSLCTADHCLERLNRPDSTSTGQSTPSSSRDIPYPKPYHQNYMLETVGLKIVRKYL